MATLRQLRRFQLLDTDKLSVLADDPGGHAALILNDGGLEWVEEFAAEVVGELEEEWLIDEEALGPVRGAEASALEMVVLHADGGGETAEEETAGLKGFPCGAQHGFEVIVIAGEVEDSAQEDDVHEGLREGVGFDSFDAEVLCGKGGREGCGDPADVVDRRGIGVDAINLITLAEQVDEVAAGAAADIEDAHAGRDAGAEELIEEVDVDGAELFLKRGHGSRLLGQ
jgi:hypothetical protein